MKETNPGEPVQFGEATLTPIEERGIHCLVRNGRVWCYAFKRPVGISIITPQGDVTFDIPGPEPSAGEQK